MKALLGTKVGMTQVLQEDGVAVPVTLIQAGPCVVTQRKTVETDGYAAVQIGFGEGKRLNKSLTGHVKAAQATPKYLREFRAASPDEALKVGGKIDVSAFEVGEHIDVTGTSKGKGFAGTIKRHNFAASKRTHGGKGYVRKPGSIGSMYPQKIFKGKRMAGQMGSERVTVKNLAIALIDTENNVIGVKGAVPGPRRGLIMIREVA